MLLESSSGGIVLDWDGVAARNAGHGLQLVVLCTTYDTAAREPALVIGTLFRAFVETHRGYRIHRIINEVIGCAGVDAITRADVFDVHGRFPAICAAVPLPSVVGVLTRERAAARHSPLVGMFAYNPPRAMFTRAEQQLLIAAIDGAPDDVVSASSNWR